VCVKSGDSEAQFAPKPLSPSACGVPLASQRENLTMPFFECTVSRTIFTDELTTKRATENVYVEAKDEREAKQKAVHPRNWLTFDATFAKADKSSSFLIAVGECSRVANDKVKALRLVEGCGHVCLSHQSPL
jgi:hypothetical protein